jgi:hypothetical protein
MDIVLVLGAFASMLLGFYGLVKFILAQHEKAQEADRNERQELTKAIKDMADSSKAVAKATTKSALEAKDRNGHLGEQNIQIAELVSAQNKDVTRIKDTNAEILKAFANLAGEQHIEHQIVEHQEVKNT